MVKFPGDEVSRHLPDENLDTLHKHTVGYVKELVEKEQIDGFYPMISAYPQLTMPFMCLTDDWKDDELRERMVFGYGELLMRTALADGAPLPPLAATLMQEDELTDEREDPPAVREALSVTTLVVDRRIRATALPIERSAEGVFVVREVLPAQENRLPVGQRHILEQFFAGMSKAMEGTESDDWIRNE